MNQSTTILSSLPIIEDSIPSLQKQISQLREKGILLHLAIVLVGENPASMVYTKNKQKFCERIGAQCTIFSLNQSISEKELTELISSLNQREDIHGILVQLPLPPHLQNIDINEIILPSKDVDGFGKESLANLMLGFLPTQKNFLCPCTPMGVLTLLDYYKIELEGKNVLIIGRSLIVGRPLQQLLVNRNATTILAHSKTKNLIDLVKISEIIFLAVGRPKFFDEKFHTNDSSIIVDIGINRDSSHKIVGDCDFDFWKNHSKAITPVPGGIGPLTILSLAQNLVKSVN